MHNRASRANEAPLSSFPENRRGFPVPDTLPAVELHPLTARDMPMLWLLHSDPRAFELDTIGPLTTVDQMERVCAQWLAAAEADGFGHQRVLSPEGNAVGVAGLSRMKLSGRWVANAYVRLFPEAWGYGYAQAALRLCMRQVQELKLGAGFPAVPDEAVFVTADQNVPARKLAQAVGFVLSDEEDPTETGAHVVYVRPLQGAGSEREGAPSGT